jgi:cbb3-type cytochrome oxidase subunit 3
MIWAYVYTLHPKNKEKFESQSSIPMDDENDAEDTK